MKFHDGPAAGVTMEYEKEAESVRYGFWTYEHSHRREGDYWLFVRRLNPRAAQRVVKQITAARDGRDPRLEEKRQPDRVIQRGRNEMCWCGSGKKFKRCHGTGTWAAEVPA